MWQVNDPLPFNGYGAVEFIDMEKPG